MNLIEIERDRLAQWRADNADKIGTPQYRKATLSHRVLTDLIDGGDATEAARQLKHIEDGTHSALATTKGSG